RIDSTGELNKDAVPRRLDDSAGVLGHGGIDQFTPVCRQGGKRAVLVGTHEPAEARDISHQDDAQSPGVLFRCHVSYRATIGAMELMAGSAEMLCRHLAAGLKF